MTVDVDLQVEAVSVIPDPTNINEVTTTVVVVALPMSDVMVVVVDGDVGKLVQEGVQMEAIIFLGNHSH